MIRGESYRWGPVKGWKGHRGRGLTSGMGLQKAVTELLSHSGM